MGLSQASAAPRMTEVPTDITATLESVASDGKRRALAWLADKYGTVKVRAYLPEQIDPAVLDGFVLDFGIDGTLAEPADDNTNRRQIVARSVITFTKAGKPSGFTSMGNDSFGDTALIVVNVPNWATVDTITLKAA